MPLRNLLAQTTPGRVYPAALVALLLATAPLAAAGPAYRVKDVKTESPSLDIPWPWGSWSGEWQGSVYIGTTDGIHGNELWRWTPGSTPELLADICPGECGSWPREFIPLGAHFYFTAEDADHGRELWRSDGTRAGTALVADIDPGLDASSPDFLTAGADGKLYFSAGRDQREGRELWTSDGTPEGTYEVADIKPGPDGSNPTSIVAHAGALFFTADDGLTGRELWTSDGTAPGTHLVEDFCPGEADCLWEEQLFLYEPRVLHSAKNGLMLVTGAQAQLDGLALLPDDTGSIESVAVDPYALLGFSALSEVAVFEACAPHPNCGLWRSDGTAAGTYALYEAPLDSFRAVVGVAGGWAFFTLDIDGVLELWRNDGTVGGTERVRAFGPVQGIEAFIMARGTAVGDRLFFATADGATGIEPWVTDGTAAETFQLADVFPGEIGSLSPFVPQRFAETAGEIAFFAMHPDDDFALWSTDLTSAGTALVADLDQQISGVPTALLHGSNLSAGSLGGRLIFGADDSLVGIEPWITDGTEAGTSLLADLEPGETSPGNPLSSNPVAILEDSGAAVIVGSRLWATDGTAAGTVELSEDGGEVHLLTRQSIIPGGVPEVFLAGGTLSVTDGTPGGTLELETEVGYDRPVASRNAIFLSRTEASSGEELWSTPGGPNEATIVRDINPGHDSSSPILLADLGGLVLLSADDGASGQELWRSDGTEAGTFLLRDIDPDGDGAPLLGRRALAWSGAHGPAILNGRLYFTANDGANGRELWSTDGTTSGTALAADINLGPLPSDPSELVVAGQRLFFFANDGASGRELWTLPRGEARARRVMDINPGVASATPIQRLGRRIQAVGDRVYFSAHDGASGAELWTSDGTAQGTLRLHDINPGPGSSSPSNFVVAGNCLYFSATDGVTGFELWAFPLTPQLGLGETVCTPDPNNRSPGSKPLGSE